MRETEHVHPEIRKELIGADVRSVESWDDGGAKVKFSGRFSFKSVKALNEKGYVVGGIFDDGDDGFTVFVEADIL